MTGDANYPPGATFGPRLMRDYEFVWIIKGDVIWECDGKRFAAPPGTVLLSRAGQREMYWWDPLHPTRHAFFHFSIDLCGAVLPPENQWPQVQHMTDNDIIRPLFTYLFKLMAVRTPEWEALIQNTARQIFLAFLTGTAQADSGHRTELSEPIQRAMKYVRKEWNEGALQRDKAMSSSSRLNARPQFRIPPLQELARAAAASERHLCRLFKKELGLGPIEALRLLTLDHAAMLLLRTNLRVKAIADMTGFENPFHFSRCFRQAFGISPRGFRVQIAKGVEIPQERIFRARRLME